jgi:Ni/Fe-hydrogenase 1 B-type cytochrome subunit
MRVAGVTHEPEELEARYVWDLVVRISHWLIVFSMVVLVFTGLDMSRPFLGGGKFVTGWVKVVHYYAAIVFSLAVAARIAWMFLGPRAIGWRQFVPITKARRHDLIETAKFYMLINSRPPVSVGHNPLAGLSYIFVFSLYVLMTLTGFALYSVSAYTSYMKAWGVLLPLFGGAQGARWLHHATMWVLILFVIFHISAALLTSRAEKNGVLDSIFSGYKFLPKGKKDDV